MPFLFLYPTINFLTQLQSVRRLNGFDDQNFHVRVEEHHSNPHIQSVAEDGYVLKIMNSKDTKEEKPHLRE